MLGFQTVTDLIAGADVLRRRRYGRIEVADGAFRCVRLRPYPSLVSKPRIWLLGRFQHRFIPGDRCWLYYNQPLWHSNYLALSYVVASRDSTLASVDRALEVLDEIARLKKSDAILADVSNRRFSDRILARRGWEPHCPALLHRHFIKRFYGQYPPRPRWIERLDS